MIERTREVPASTESIELPDMDIQLHSGDKVRLGRFSSKVWTVNFGWFSYAGNRPFCGWFLTSDEETKPLQLTDTYDIYLVE